MPVTLDIFNSNEFSVEQMTQAINIIPNNYGRVQQLGIFKDEPIRTTVVNLEMENGVLNVLSPQERGAPSTVNKSGKRKVIPFQTLHFPHEDRIMPDEIQNIRAFGTESELTQVQDIVLRRMEEMKRKHAITLEYLRCGALQGIIRDDQGNVLLNLYEVFGITPLAIDFDLGNLTTDVGSKVRQMTGSIEDNLMGETTTGIHALSSAGWFEKFITHPSVKDAYKYFTSTVNPLREDARKGFEFNGVIFEEYRGKSTNSKGEMLPFIPDGDVRFFPMGTQNTFRTFFSPGDFMETVNTPGLPVYAKQEMGEFNRFVKIHTQSNPLPIVKRPNLLGRGYSSN